MCVCLLLRGDAGHTLGRRRRHEKKSFSQRLLSHPITEAHRKAYHVDLKPSLIVRVIMSHRFSLSLSLAHPLAGLLSFRLILQCFGCNSFFIYAVIYVEARGHKSKAKLVYICTCDRMAHSV